jgi:hypothetical protein
MLAFPGMIAPAAEEAGIELPPNIEGYDPDEYPHWHIFQFIQLGTAMPHPAAHWDNAKVIATIPIEDIRHITMNDLLEKGLAVGYPVP